jgi:hypothetical protein
MIQNKTGVLNLKSRKTQVPIGYLTLVFITTNYLNMIRVNSLHYIPLYPITIQ